MIRRICENTVDVRHQIVFLSATADTFEISSPGKAPRSILRTEIDALAGEPLPENRADMVALGKRLFSLLNGPESRLASLPQNSALELHISTEPGESATLAHVAWELLHDGRSFLVQRGVVPVRVVCFESQQRSEPSFEPANRPLNLAFMACSPRNVHPMLDFEGEERIILEATQNQPIYLIPEETGSIEELRQTARSYPAFDVFHLTGHGDLYHDGLKRHLAQGQSIEPESPVFLTENERGDAYLADAEAFEAAFENRIPRLVFLSGCRTGELPESGPEIGEAEKREKRRGIAHTSLAQDLLFRGFPAVLGWGWPVGDRAATVAAGIDLRRIGSLDFSRRCNPARFARDVEARAGWGAVSDPRLVPTAALLYQWLRFLAIGNDQNRQATRTVRLSAL